MAVSPFGKEQKMDIRTYEMVIDTETKQSSLVVKESFAYGEECFCAPLSIATLMKEVFRLHEMADEYVYMLAFNYKMTLLGVFEISHGTGNASLLDARGVFMRALYVGASQIVLIHNHPSGKVEASNQDLHISKRIKEVGELMGIALSDHIIVGSSGYLSFHESGLM